MIISASFLAVTIHLSKSTVSLVNLLQVEGGSGDGVVRPKSERQSIQGRVVSELYAEIDEPPGT